MRTGVYAGMLRIMRKDLIMQKGLCPLNSKRIKREFPLINPLGQEKSPFRRIMSQYPRIGRKSTFLARKPNLPMCTRIRVCALCAYARARLNKSNAHYVTLRSLISSLLGALCQSPYKRVTCLSLIKRKRRIKIRSFHSLITSVARLLQIPVGIVPSLGSVTMDTILGFSSYL